MTSPRHKRRRMKRVRLYAGALFRHSRGFPFATNLSLVSIPIGLAAVGIGQDVSRAFTILWPGAPQPVYVWGAVLVVGGINVAAGIALPRPSLERAGLSVLAAAFAFYGLAVLVALQANGLVTGGLALTIALSAMQRAHIILRSAQRLIRANTLDEAREAAEEVISATELNAGALERAAGLRHHGGPP